MKDVRVIGPSGIVLHRSRNLRAIMEYAARCEKSRFCFGPTELEQDRYRLTAHFPDGSTCKTDFADEKVLRKWITDRVRFGRGKFVATDGNSK